MDRFEQLRKHIRHEMRGIEIGPFHSPIAPRKLGYNSIVLDVFDATELRRQAKVIPNLPFGSLDEIEDVDLLGSAGDIAELVAGAYGSERFDYVVSSHNMEHLPDPIRFLQGCERILKPGGSISMAIPDRRFCFDFYRPLTDLSEWLQAYDEKRRQPTEAQVFRHHAYQSLLRGSLLGWSAGDLNGEVPTPLETLDTAYDDWRKSTDTDRPYKDCHCWTFAPASFELLISDLQFLGLIGLTVDEITGPNAFEFYVHLKVPSAQTVTERADYFQRRGALLRRLASEQSLPASGSAEGEIAQLRAELALKDAELTRLQHSRSWRLTAPARSILERARELRASARSS